MRRSVYLLAISLLAACDSGTPSPQGPVALAVDPATNRQVALAAVGDSLPKAVTAVVYREPSGSITLRMVTPAYAQTTVNGAPVPGALVNAVGVGDCPLKAWNPAALTDANGAAQFWFEPGTKVGECRAEIRYADETQRVVTDSVVATIEPGAIATVKVPRHLPNFAIDENVLFPPSFFDAYGNSVPFTVTATGAFRGVQRVGGGSWGFAVQPGSVPGDTGTITFHRDETPILTAEATLKTGTVADLYSVDLSY